MSIPKIQKAPPRVIVRISVRVCGERGKCQDQRRNPACAVHFVGVKAPQVDRVVHELMEHIGNDRGPKDGNEGKVGGGDRLQPAERSAIMRTANECPQREEEVAEGNTANDAVDLFLL